MDHFIPQTKHTINVCIENIPITNLHTLHVRVFGEDLPIILVVEVHSSMKNGSDK
jgi:hypothetical protein